MTSWKYMVAKHSRGARGQWFSHYDDARHFAELADAIAYARQFAEDQHAALGNTNGHRYVVSTVRGVVTTFTIRAGVRQST